jgi:soluble lytic murein transglycosylase-like protein
MLACLLLIGAAALEAGGLPLRARTVVRADAKSGRLVRTVVMSPRVLPAVPASRPPASEEASDGSVSELVEAVAKQYDVDPLLVHSLIQVESGYDVNAVSHKGAQGLMQLMPETAKRFGVRNSFDTRENLEGGVRYLKYLDTLFPNDLDLKLAAYNAGEGAVWKYRNNIPPYRETQQYVSKVGARYGKALRKVKMSKSQNRPGETAVTPQPEFASVQSFVDSEGRLHLRTVNQSDSTVSTP